MARSATGSITIVDINDGTDGTDGVGVEYVFQATNSSSAPTSPLNTSPYDQPTSPWTDGAPALTTLLPYLWRTVRKVLGSPTAGDSPPGTAPFWGNWDTPTIEGRFGTDGTDGTDGIDGIDGTDGAEGVGIEYVFQATNSASAPTSPLNTASYDQPTSPWTDGAPALTALLPYLWRTTRWNQRYRWNQWRRWPTSPRQMGHSCQFAPHYIRASRDRLGYDLDY